MTICDFSLSSMSTIYLLFALIFKRCDISYMILHSVSWAFAQGFSQVQFILSVIIAFKLKKSNMLEITMNYFFIKSKSIINFLVYILLILCSFFDNFLQKRKLIVDFCVSNTNSAPLFLNISVIAYLFSVLSVWTVYVFTLNEIL